MKQTKRDETGLAHAADLVHGQGIQGADQAAMQVRFRNQRRAEEHRDSPVSIPTVAGEDWERDWQARARVAKRGNRGGSTFRPGDGIVR